MSLLRLIVSITALILSCKASGIGHLIPAVKSIPIVRYAPFYNFPNAVKSIHAVAPPPLPAVASAFPAPATLLPAPLAAPVLPPPPLSASFLPAPAFAPAPVLPAPAFAHAPAVPAPVLPASTFATAYAPAFRAVASAPFIAPILPKIAPAIPALPSVPAVGPTLFRAVPALQHAPFTPIVRPISPALPAPIFAPAAAPAPFAVAKVIPYDVAPYANHLHHYGKYLSPAHFLPSPPLKQVAWK